MRKDGISKGFNDRKSDMIVIRYRSKEKKPDILTYMYRESRDKYKEIMTFI